MSFRRFIVPSLEELDVASSDIIDTKAIVDTIMDPAVANPEPVVDTTAEDKPAEPAEQTPAEPVVAEEPAAPAADAPAADPIADVNTPASTPEEPAPAETPPAEPVVTEPAPSSDATTPAEPVAQAPAEPIVDTPADAAPAAPVVAAPETPVEEQTAGGETHPAVIEPAAELSEDEVSLEELDARAEIVESINSENDMLSNINDARADDAVEDQLYAVLESLEVLAENTAELIETEACTEQTAQIIEDSAKSTLSQVGVDLVLPAMESYGNDVKIRHQMVLESLDTYAGRIRQTLDINLKQIADQFRVQYLKYKENVSKVKRNVEGVRAQYSKNKNNFTDKQHEGSLTAVSRFFNVDTGDILPILMEDTSISKYILSEYPKDIIKNIEKLNNLLKNTTYKTPEEFGKFLEKVGEIKSQAKIFKEAPNGKMVALLGNYGIVREMSGAQKTLSFDQMSFPTLAEASRFDAYRMHQGNNLLQIIGRQFNDKHPVVIIGKIIIGVAISIYEIVAAHKVVLTTNEIGKLIEMSEEYVKNSLDWISTSNQILSTYKELEVGMKKFSSIGSDIDKISITQRYRAWRLLSQVKRVVRNQLQYLDTPTALESYRALQGARNCYYLANRFLKTAK